MKKEARHGAKRAGSLILALLVIFAMLPSSAFADAIKIEQPKETGFVYYYTGNNQSPDSKANAVNGAHVIYQDEKYQPDIYKYQLALKGSNPLSTLWTYCSDFAIAPQAWMGTGDDHRLYQRIPLENVTAGTGFFAGSVEASAARLRAILLNSDLWLDLNTMASRSAITTLTAPEAVAATQLAIWNVVNNAIPEGPTGAFGNKNVQAYYNYLTGLPGVSPDKMAHIEMGTITKVTSGNNTYQATMQYSIVGEGIDPANVKNNVTVTATYGAGPAANVPDGDIAINGNTIKISNIPLGATLNVTIKGAQDHVKTVYLFAPKERASTQTLVSVVDGPVDLATTVEISSPSNLARLTIYKDWKTGAGAMLPNAAVADYESVFRFTYADGGFKDVKVIEDQTIKGNGAYTTGDHFEKNVLYKIEEISVAPSDGVTKATPKYFKVDDNKTIVWTDSMGKALPSQDGASRFVNVKDVNTGSLEVKKTVTNGGKEAEAFKFVIQWTAPGSVTAKPYAGENYTYYEKGSSTAKTGKTGADGSFTLKEGERAVFENVPVGSKFTVTEDAALEARYAIENGKTAALTLQDSSKSVTFNNAYRVGNLTITKEFSAGSALDWNNKFKDADSALSLTVSGPDGYSKPVYLHAGQRTITLNNVPIGKYTITEEGAQTGYELTVNGAVSSTGKGAVTADVEEGKTVGAKFINSYRMLSGSLKITKDVTGDFNKSNIGKTFTFKITGPGYSDTVTLPKENLWEATLTGLTPGNYTVTEIASGIEEALKNLTVTVNGEVVTKGVAPEPGYASAKAVIDQGTTVFAYVNNYSEQTGILTVEKKLTLDGAATTEALQTFAFKVINESGTTIEGGTFTLPDESGAWKKTFTTLTPGNYTVIETNSGQAITNYTFGGTTYAVDNGSSGTAEAVARVYDNQTTKATVTNAYTRTMTGQVSVTKKTVNDPSNDGFEFVIKVDGKVWAGKPYSGGTTGSGGQFTLQHNQTATFTGLPLGASVLITETRNDNYTTTATANGTVIAGTALQNIEFVNTRKAIDLSLVKTLSGADWTNFPAGICFTIVGPANWAKDLGSGDDPKAAFALLGLTEVDETTYTIFVKNSDELTFAGVPAGTYTVTEEVAEGAGGTADRTGYTRTTSYVVTSGGVKAADTTGTTTGKKVYTTNSAIAFKNSYAQKIGKFEFTKTFDYTPNAGDQFEFTIHFDKAVPENVQLAFGNAGKVDENWQSDRKKVTLVLKFTGKSGTITITGIPEGTKCTVTETGYNGYYAAPNPNTTNGAITNNGTLKLSLSNVHKMDGKLAVEKKVVFNGSSANYNEEYTFTITVAGSLWKNKAYSLSTGGAGTTDASGQFRLKAGQIATFEGLPLGVDYKVTEGSGFAYDTVATATSGAISTAAITAVFTNTYKPVSLTVMKTVTGDARDDADAPKSFTFELKRGSVLVTNAAFTVTGEGPASSSPTGSDGRFTLGAGQQASFTRLPAGNYTVTEITSLDAASPLNMVTTVIEGQNRTTAKSKSKDIYVSFGFNFENQITYKAGGLDVEKKVTVTGKGQWENFTAPQAFSFTLYSGSEQSKTAVGNKAYTLTKAGGQTENKSTDANGVFTLKDGEKAVFTGLKNGNYFVVEDQAAESIKVTGYSLTVTGDGANNTKTVASTGDVPKITVTNAYERDTNTELTVSKAAITSTGDSTVAAGKTFTFKLYAGSVSDGNLVKNWSADNSAGTGANGEFTITTDANGEGAAIFRGLPSGTYVAAETGYDVIGGYARVETGSSALTLSGKTNDGAIAFTNVYERKTGNLTIKKEIDANSAYKPAAWEYNFTIKGPDDWDGSGLTQAEAGVYTFKLSNAAVQLTLTGIPGGEYIITEMEDAEVSGYALTVSATGLDANGVAAVGGEMPNVPVKFTNSYRLIGGGFTLTKNLDGISWPEIGINTFNFVLEKKSGESWTAEESNIELTEGKTIFKKDLAEGVYRIKEVNAPAIDKYTYTGKTYKLGESAATPDGEGWITFTVTDKTAAEVSCMNKYVKDGAILRVTKTVNGYTNNDSFKFKIEGPNSADREYAIEGQDVPGRTGADGTFLLKAGQTAVFTGLDTLTTYTVTEIDIPYTFVYTSVMGESFAYTIHAAEEGAAFSEAPDSRSTLENVAPKEQVQAFAGAMAAKQGDTFPGMEITFNNTRLTGELNVSKTVTGDLYKEGPFKFYVTFAKELAGDGGIVSIPADLSAFAKDLGITGISDWTVDEENNCLILDISGGEAAKITGIPAGLHYKVNEKTEDNYYQIKATGNEGRISSKEAANCSFENTRKTGLLNISKSVIRDVQSDGAIDVNETFTIQVTFKTAGKDFDAGTLEKYFDFGEKEHTIVMEDGKTITATFSLRDAESMNIEKIPVGLTYEIKELLTASQQQYVSRIVGADGMVNPYVETTGKNHPEKDYILVYNYALPTTTLDIYKTVKAAAKSTFWEAKYGFTLTLMTPGEGTVYDKYLADEQLDKITPVRADVVGGIKALEKVIADKKAEGGMEEPGIRSPGAISEDPEVQSAGAIDIEEDLIELQGLKDDLKNIDKIIDLLKMGVYVEFDSRYEITNMEDDAIAVVPIELANDQVRAYKAEDDGTKTPLGLSEIGFTKNSDGTYSFSLMHNQHIQISGLPDQAAYTVVESHIPSGYESLKECTIEAGKGAVINSSDRSVSGTISVSGDPQQVGVIGYTNAFHDVTGKLKVQKVWASETDRGQINEVTVTLTVNGAPDETRKLVLSADKGWNGEFTDLELGNTYGVLEKLPVGFGVTYSDEILLEYGNKIGETITVTNSKTPETPEEPEKPEKPEDPRKPFTPVTPSTPGNPTDIEDNETPTSDAPAIKPELVIPENDVPLADIPQTGADEGMAFHLSMLGISLSALLTVLFGRKKNNKAV